MSPVTVFLDMAGGEGTVGGVEDTWVPRHGRGLNAWRRFLMRRRVTDRDVRGSRACNIPG